MESDASLNSKSRTTRSRSRPRYTAVYNPTPEHHFAPGLPARDLSEAEVEQYGIEALTNAQCYVLVEVEPLPEDDETEE